MTKLFDFPVDKFDRDDETERLFQEMVSARQHNAAMIEGLKSAYRSQKRSPKKWGPIVERLEGEQADAQEAYEAAERDYNEARERDNEIRRQTKRTMSEAILKTLGRVDEFENGVRGVRIQSGEREILVYEATYDSFSYEVAFVTEAGTDKIDRWGPTASITGPRQMWTKLDTDDVERATLRWSSASSMDEAAAESALAIYRVGLAVLTAVNGTFGL